MELTYTPSRTTAYTARLKGLGTHLQVEISGLPAEDAEVDRTGDPELLANRTLVSLVESFGEHEYWYRRLRAREKRTSHQAAAESAHGDAISLARLVSRLTEECEFGWCSGCLYWTQHRLVDGRRVVDAWICSSCGIATTPCAVPGCGHMAVRGYGRSVPRYCAPHRHEIPSFEKLDVQLESLLDYEGWLEFDYRNATSVTTLAMASVAAMAVVMPLGMAAAPAVGGALGATTGLSGAAATSHGLALLGGGAVSAGGLGMAGGTAVVTAAGSALGGALGASVASAYVSSDDSFGITRLRSGDGATVVFATGFLSEGRSGWGEWRDLIDGAYPDSTVYRVNWGASELAALGRMLSVGGARAVARSKLRVLAMRAGKKAAGRLGPLGAVLLASDVFKNPWTVARTRASMTGAVLAELLSRTHEGPFTLLGHSLGGRVMAHTGLALGTVAGKPQVDAMHLLGAAVGNDTDWRLLSKAVSGTVTNYWSKNDNVLRRLYRTAERGEHAIGHVGMKSKFPNVRDRNVSRKVPTHTSYVREVRLEI